MISIKPRPIQPLCILVDQLDRTLELKQLVNVLNSLVKPLTNASQLAISFYNCFFCNKSYKQR